MQNSLKELSERIQDDLICLLDSQFGEVEYVDEVKTLACQIIVDQLKTFQEENAIVPVISK